MEFNYYYGTQADQFTFIRIPKILLTGEMFSSLSLQAKVLYGVLLDRMGLSMKNGWTDQNNRVYIIYQISEIQEDLGFSKKKAIDYLAELEKIGLVEKKRRGLGLASILYIKSFLTEDMKDNSRSSDLDTSTKCLADEGDVSKADMAIHNIKIEAKTVENTAGIQNNSIVIQKEIGEDSLRSVNLGTSGSVKNKTSRGTMKTLHEVSKQRPLNNNTNINNTELNNIQSNHISEMFEYEMGMDEMVSYEELIRENIDFDILLERYPLEKDYIKEMYYLIVESVFCQNKTMVIASNSYPTELVKSKFLKLDAGHIEYVLGCLQTNTTKIKNIKKYLLAALFNAPSTINNYYRAEVNHDLPQFAVRG